MLSVGAPVCPRLRVHTAAVLITGANVARGPIRGVLAVRVGRAGSRDGRVWKSG